MSRERERKKERKRENLRTGTRPVTAYGLVNNETISRRRRIYYATNLYELLLRQTAKNL
jgi:hypothetical protein